MLFDLQPVPEAGEADDDWVPDPEPSQRDHGRARRRGPRDVPARRSPAAPSGRSSTRGRAVAGSTEALEGVGELGWAFANPAPDVPLNVEIGSHRRFEWVRADLAHFKRIKDAFGGTVNDVVLAVVTGALRAWLHGRGIRTEGLELRAQVPVSIRASDEHGELGNRITVMRAPIPVYVDDPVARLRTVAEAMDGIKQSKQAVGAEVISRLQRLRPADPAGAGRADQLLDPALQPRRHQRPGAADAALRARPRAPGHLPGRLPAAQPGALHRDHELQRRHELRPPRRLRRDATTSDVVANGIEQSLAELLEAAAAAEQAEAAAAAPSRS